MTKISVVTSLYKSEKYIEEFTSRMAKTISGLGLDYEIILVNDCCPSSSLEVALDVVKKNSKVKLIDLAANANHHKAVMTGLKNSIGDYVFTIDVDLEEEPELFLKFWDKIKSNPDLDLVYGIQDKRDGGFARGFCANIFYKIFGILTDCAIPNQMMVRLMSQRFIKNLTSFGEREIFISGLISLNGFKSDSVPCQKPFKGNSSYDFKKRINLAIDAVTSFSNRPLMMIATLGSLISFSAFLFGFYLVFKKIIFDSVVSGWSSIMVSIWMVGGIIIFCLGIIAVYLSKIFIEVKKRPYSIIRAKYGFDD